MAYSEDRKSEVLAALAANGGNLRKTARDTGMPVATVKLWRDGPKTPAVQEKCTEKKGTIADALESIVWQVLGLLPDKLPAASLHELNGTLKIATETTRLLRGEPTAITENRGELTPDERRKCLVDLLGRGEGRAGLGTPDAGGAGGSGRAPAGAPPVH